MIHYALIFVFSSPYGVTTTKIENYKNLDECKWARIEAQSEADKELSMLKNLSLLCVPMPKEPKS